MKRIREEREKMSYTLQQLADILGIAQNTLHNYEHSKRFPNVEMLIKLADIFNCSIDYLVGRTDIRDPDGPSKVVNINNVEMHISKECLSQLTPNDVRRIVELIENVGFDLNKIINDKRT